MKSTTVAPTKPPRVIVRPQAKDSSYQIRAAKPVGRMPFAMAPTQTSRVPPALFFDDASLEGVVAWVDARRIGSTRVIGSVSNAKPCGGTSDGSCRPSAISHFIARLIGTGAQRTNMDREVKRAIPRPPQPVEKRYGVAG